MFKEFKKIIQDQYNEMAQKELFVVDIDSDKLWQTYLVILT